MPTPERRREREDAMRRLRALEWRVDAHVSNHVPPQPTTEEREMALARLQVLEWYVQAYGRNPE